MGMADDNYYFDHRDQQAAPMDGPNVEPEYIDAVTAHVERTVGKTGNLFHEILSPYVHLDILMVPPGWKRPWTTLVTCGMGSRPMNTPPELQSRSRMELAICLPADWPPLTSDSVENMGTGPGAWIIPLLQFHARLPFQYNTWFGEGHTIPNGDPPEPLSEGSQLCCAMIAKPKHIGNRDFHRLQLDNEEYVHFWSLVFITQAELSYKFRRGTANLMQRFKEHKVDELLKLDRPSTCRGGLLGLFGFLG